MLEIKFELAMDVGEVDGVEHAPLFIHFGIERCARNGGIQHELVKIRFVADSVFNFFGDVRRSMVLEANDGGALHSNAMLAQFVRQSCVSLPSNLAYLEFTDSRPIQIQEMPSSTSSCMEYLRIAFADANTAKPQLLPAAFMRSSNCMAR